MTAEEQAGKERRSCCSCMSTNPCACSLPAVTHACTRACVHLNGTLASQPSSEVGRYTQIARADMPASDWCTSNTGQFRIEVNAQDSHGETPLHLAARHDHESICRALLQHPVCIRFGINRASRLPAVCMMSQKQYGPRRSHSLEPVAPSHICSILPPRMSEVTSDGSDGPIFLKKTLACR